MKSRISLRDWIDREGAGKLAAKLNVKASTVRHWKNGHCLPSDKQKRAIKKLSKGEVTYDSMIDPHFENRGV